MTDLIVLVLSILIVLLGGVTSPLSTFLKIDSVASIVYLGILTAFFTAMAYIYSAEPIEQFIYVNF